MKAKLYPRLAMVFAAIFMFTLFAAAQTTISVAVVDDMDDAEEYQQEKSPEEPVGFMDMTSSDLELCNETEGVQQLVGIIFRNVQIPAGATVTNAFVQFTADDDNDEAITLDIWGAKAATVAAPFTGDPFGVSSQPKTTAKVEWTPPPWTADMVGVNAQGPEQQTPDLSTIIQEIIGVAGWAPGNNVMIMLLDPSGTVKQHREAESFNGAEGHGNLALAPTLNVTFTSGGTGIDSYKGLSYAVYPNPTKGKLTIDNPSGNAFSYEIFSISGQRVAHRYNLSGATAELDMSDLAKGMYFVNLKSGEGTETHKLILE